MPLEIYIIYFNPSTHHRQIPWYCRSLCWKINFIFTEFVIRASVGIVEVIPQIDIIHHLAYTSHNLRLSLLLSLSLVFFVLLFQEGTDFQKSRIFQILFSVSELVAIFYICKGIHFRLELVSEAEA